MVSFLQQIYGLLTTNPGNLTYHLVVAFSIAGALPAALNQWRNLGYPQSRRLVAGLSLLLALRVALFVSSAFAWNLPVFSHALVPIERAVTIFSLVFIIWLWAFPESSLLVDAVTFVLLLLFFLLFAFDLVWWMGRPTGAMYNASLPDQIGEIGALGLILLGCILILIRRPNSWGIGLSMLGLLFAGHLLHYLLPDPASNLPGSVRLAQMAAYPLLLTLPQRFGAGAPQATRPAGISLPQVDPATLKALLALSTETNPDLLYPDIARALAHLFQADLCLLVSPADERGELQVRSGFNRSKDEVITPLTINGRLTPMLKQALQRGRTLRLPSSSTSGDLLGLAQALGLNQAGNLLVAPVKPDGKSTTLGITLLSPYSNRSWSTEDQNYLAYAASLVVPLLGKIAGGSSPQGELSQIRAQLLAAQQNLERIQLDKDDLFRQLETQRQDAQREHTRAESLAALIASQEQTQEIAHEPGTELKPEPSQNAPEVGQLEGELRLALEEISQLHSSISRYEQKIKELEIYTKDSPVSVNQMEAIASITQELRQPMSSVIGYTDLLLGESAGILGALQRKFLERVKASTERIGGLVDELIQIGSTTGGHVKQVIEKVSISDVIDEAIAMTMGQLREKNILLRVDIPEDLPQVTADRDSMQQMLIHLLQNAGSASRIEGEISLRASVTTEDEKQDYVLLQVTDSGGGISADDLPRVFSRLYRADNLLIKGVGETGVGLSIVKTLVEAHGGRIWVDSEIGSGSTFSILLPINPDPQAVASPGVQPA